ncbi:hypothetical protein ACH5RR_032707 [Cinchona calisaya]|uniref:Uncharacterized protein n=1 Tax=Cinchona calisaya TaxID=153742 RepID=A0ABD2YN17_9GENT
MDPRAHFAIWLTSDVLFLLVLLCYFLGLGIRTVNKFSLQISSNMKFDFFTSFFAFGNDVVNVVICLLLEDLDDLSNVNWLPLEVVLEKYETQLIIFQ